MVLNAHEEEEQQHQQAELVEEELEPAPPLPLRVCEFGIYDSDGAPTPLRALGNLQSRLHLRGRLAEAGDEESARVESDALVRWYVNYATTPPEVMMQAMDRCFVVPVEVGAAAGEYTPVWRPLVKSVALASRVLRAARDRVPDVWAYAAGGLSEDELVREWPFVRGQMRALAVRTIRAPGSKSPGWAALGELDAEDADTVEDGTLGRTRKRRQLTSAEEGRVAKRGAGSEVVLEEETPPHRPALEPGEELEVQAYRCRTPRYDALRRCRSCAMNRSEQCRFRFMRRLATREGASPREARVVRDLGSFEHGSGYRLASAKHAAPADGESEVVATAALQAQAGHAAYILSHLAAPFARVVALEAGHSGGEPVIVVNAKARGAPAKTAFVPKGYSKEGGERQVCDWCASTMFARYRTCIICGFEVCLQCAASWRQTAKPAAVSRLCPHAMAEWHVFTKVSTHMMAALTSGAAACSLTAVPTPQDASGAGALGARSFPSLRPDDDGPSGPRVSTGEHGVRLVKAAGPAHVPPTAEVGGVAHGPSAAETSAAADQAGVASAVAGPSEDPPTELYLRMNPNYLYYYLRSYHAIHAIT